MKTIKANKENLEEIITALKNGAVLILPTDTVYGLVCDASNEKAVEKIFEIKKRDKSKPLAVFVKDIEQAKNLAIISANQENYLKENWPGAITVILGAKKVDVGRLSNLLYKDGNIGIRIPNHEFLNLILNEFGGPLAQTSANISGEETSAKISDIKDQFKNGDILVVDAGELTKAKPSKVTDFSGEQTKIIRD